MADYKIVSSLNKALKSQANQEDHIYFVKNLNKDELKR